MKYTATECMVTMVMDLIFVLHRYFLLTLLHVNFVFLELLS